MTNRAETEFFRRQAERERAARMQAEESTASLEAERDDIALNFNLLGKVGRNLQQTRSLRGALKVALREIGNHFEIAFSHGWVADAQPAQSLKSSGVYESLIGPEYDDLAFALGTTRCLPGDEGVGTLISDTNPCYQQLDRAKCRSSRLARLCGFDRYYLHPIVNSNGLIGALQLFLRPDNRLPKSGAMVIGEIALQIALASHFSPESSAAPKLETFSCYTEGNEAFLEIINTIPGAVFRTDSEGKLVFLSENWERITGQSVERTLGATMIDHMPEGLRMGAKQQMGDMIERGLGGDRRVCEHEFPLQLQNGALKWVRISCRAQVSQLKEFQGLVGTVADISARKAEENELHLRDLALQSIEDAVTITDPRQADNPIIYVNSAFEQMTGWSASEVIGKNPRFLQGSDTAISELGKLRTAIAGGQSCEVTLKNYRKDGSSFWNRLRVAPVLNEEGKLMNFVGSCVDLTDRLELESELRTVNGNLAETSRLKGAFLAAMSHELRTPLNAILGSSEIIRDGMLGKVTSRQQQHLENITESGNHLLNLINDILDLSKIEAGKEELQFVPVSLRKICDSSVSFVKQAAHEKRIRIETDYGDSDRHVLADQRRLKQVVVNLLSNAVKFTNEGGEVRVGVEGNDQNAEIRVWDTGIGIAKKDQERLFEPFTQLHDTLDREYSGIGLGLSLVGQLVELHGGQIQVHSEEGKGSCFTVTLPLTDHTDDADYTPAVSPAVPASAVTATRVAQQRILLAEDNEFNQDTIESFLAAHQYNVTIAKDGGEAVRMAASERPDLILMDIQMPFMDGLEATRQIRATSTNRRVPIIALTALAMPGDEEVCLSAGMDEYLSKPVRMELLLDRVRAHLEG
jgi:PAS domain S-box-containing protein